ncbi:MAG: LacI family DNA-binding transcriptional regulator [Clostridiales bacterium]|nr:LacI family DNA-binding transcriptional regulator [Clostridiales bacterium]
MTSIKKIAEIAGVSRGTVDRALNNRGEVNEEVAERIRAIARDLGYRTNRAGLALAARKHPLKIGAVFPSEGNPYFTDVITGLREAEKELSDYAVSVLLKTTRGFSADTQIQKIDELLAEGVQALILCPVNERILIDKINDLVDSGMPVITSNSDIENSRRLCYVGTDYTKSGRVAAGLMGLVASGNPMSVIILTGSIHVLGHNQSISGFYSVIKKSYPEISVLDVEETLDNSEISYEITRRILASNRIPDAIYMTAGAVGGTCKALSEAKGKPSIKLFTHDITSESRPYLMSGIISATIPQDPYQQGYLPVKMLFDYSLDKKPPKEDKVYTNSYIIVKESL